MADAVPTTRASWWGKFQLAEGEMGRWTVGPLDLWVRRTALDWRYGAVQRDEGVESAVEVEVPAAEDPTRELPLEEARIGFARTDETLEIVPALAERPVVARPSVPFFIAPGQKVDLFVSTPLWLRLRSGGTDLAEVPCTRPSDTWFGNNTRGVLSYATRTHLRRDLAELPLRPHRAVSCVTVENASDAALALERLSLPVPQLSLFASSLGSLWTERITLRNEDEDDVAEVTLGKGLPRAAGEGKRVAAPRAPQGRSFGSLVFGGLFPSPSSR